MVIFSNITTCSFAISFFFFFNDTATTEIYTLSLHDALPILMPLATDCAPAATPAATLPRAISAGRRERSEEHTSELQSHVNLVCRLLLEKKKKKTKKLKKHKKQNKSTLNHSY